MNPGHIGDSPVCKCFELIVSDTFRGKAIIYVKKTTTKTERFTYYMYVELPEDERSTGSGSLFLFDLKAEIKETYCNFVIQRLHVLQQKMERIFNISCI